MLVSVASVVDELHVVVAPFYYVGSYHLINVAACEVYYKAYITEQLQQLADKWVTYGVYYLVKFCSRGYPLSYIVIERCYIVRCSSLLRYMSEPRPTQSQVSSKLSNKHHGTCSSVPVVCGGRFYVAKFPLTLHSFYTKCNLLQNTPP